MDDETLSNTMTLTAMVIFLISGWATFWIWRARHSGWIKLAERYPALQRPTGTLPRRWLSATLKPADTFYPRLLTARLTMNGLHLAPNLLCRFGHDPILIPWDDIEIFAIETYPADRLYDLKFGRLPHIRVRVGVTVAQFIRRAADNSHYFSDETFAPHTTEQSQNQHHQTEARQTVA
jgi:hypothetical protein